MPDPTLLHALDRLHEAADHLRQARVALDGVSYHAGAVAVRLRLVAADHALHAALSDVDALLEALAADAAAGAELARGARGG